MCVRKRKVLPAETFLRRLQMARYRAGKNPGLKKVHEKRRRPLGGVVLVSN